MEPAAHAEARPPALATGELVDPCPSAIRRLASGLLVALAALLPFEAPLFRLGPLQLTSVEIVLYAVIAAWGLVVMRRWARGRPAFAEVAVMWRRDAIGAGALAWLVAVFASAFFATSFRAASFKFALRSASGVLLYFAARSLTRQAGTGRRVIWALVAGALLSAGIAILEWLVPSTSSFWSAFRESSFDTLGLTRASGVFSYPTIGAMYWEAAVPLLVVAPLLLAAAPGKRGRARPFVFAAVGSALLIGAILASATRSGVAGALAANASLLALGWRSTPNVRPPAFVGLCVIVTAWGLALSPTRALSPLGQRLRWWHDDTWLMAEYQVDVTPRSLHAGESFVLRVTVRNTGSIAWPHAGEQPVRLGYHWERAEGSSTLADYEGERTPLPTDLPPGGEVQLEARGHAPLREGSYKLRWDLAQEGVAWFSDRGNGMPAQPVQVGGELESGAPSLWAPDEGVARSAVAPQPPSRVALWRAALVLWRERPWLGIGPDNFRRSYPTVLSPAPNGQPYTDTRIHANSLYFETLADLGLAGLLALGWIGGCLVRAILRHTRSGRLAGLACGVAAAAFFVHGALDYFFEFTPLFALFWLLLGLTAEDRPSRPLGALPDSQPSGPAR